MKLRLIAAAVWASAMATAPIAAGHPLSQREPVELPWEQAVSQLESCNVAMAVQTHELEVYLTLRDGSRVVAREPMIDEVFRVLDGTRPTCGAIPIATE